VAGAESLLHAVPALGGALGKLAEKLGQVTVQVCSSGRNTGAGVVWLRSGLIITNAHVTSGPRAEVVFPDGRALPARVVARDLRRDLAALSVSVDDVEPALRMDARALRVGELVVALGHPFGVPYAASLGIVHRAPAGEPRAHGWLQADIRLAPGNSGGPLADSSGRVVGINAMIVGGLGIAVPTHLIERFVHKIEIQGRGAGGVRAA
jgi:serine protease Do